MYGIPLLTEFVRRLLSRVAPQELCVVEIASGPLTGWHMKLDLKTEKYYWLGTYEQGMEAALADFVRQGDIVYDIGANIGYFSLIFARKVGSEGQIFAFEPLPENIERLQENLMLNHREDNVTVVSSAVSDSTGTEEFLVHSLHSMGKLAGVNGRNTKYQRSVIVKSLTIDGFIYDEGKPAPDIVKMDIEGGEVKAIRGMTRLLSDKKPIILLELHGPDAARVVWDTIKEGDYELCHLRPGYPPCNSITQLNWREHVVALPKSVSC